MAWNPEKPYNKLPLLPPTEKVETTSVLKQCIRSRAALAELKQAAELIPNQAVLINTLPMLEAKDSSGIENIVTTSVKLFRYGQMSDAGPRDDQVLDAPTKEALRYRTALLEGYKSIAKRPLTTNTAEKMCTRIKGVRMQVRQVPGTTLMNDRTGKIIYTPPAGETQLRDMLSNWEKYLSEESDTDPLVRMAVAHYQFEAVHPFTDGNGRTGRILNNLFLIQEGLLTLPILYLSRYILNNREDYYRFLLNVTKTEDWESWIIYLLKAVEETSEWTTAKIAAIRKLTEVTIAHARSELPKIYTRELVDTIFEQPYCRIGDLVARGIAKRQTASEYLKKLAEIGILREEKVGREKLFVHPKLMSLLTRDSNRVTSY